MKFVGGNVDQMQAFVIVYNVGTKINVAVNVKNQLTKVYEIKVVFGLLVICNVNVINHVMSENIKLQKL